MASAVLHQPISRKIGPAAGFVATTTPTYPAGITYPQVVEYGSDVDATPRKTSIGALQRA